MMVYEKVQVFNVYNETHLEISVHLGGGHRYWCYMPMSHLPKSLPATRDL